MPRFALAVVIILAGLVVFAQQPPDLKYFNVKN